jgi:hypothetical protein
MVDTVDDIEYSYQRVLLMPLLISFIYRSKNRRFARWAILANWPNKVLSWHPGEVLLFIIKNDQEKQRWDQSNVYLDKCEIIHPLHRNVSFESILVVSPLRYNQHADSLTNLNIISFQTSFCLKNNTCFLYLDEMKSACSVIKFL